MTKADQARDLIELGQFYLINQKYSAAVKELRAGLKLDPKNVAGHFNLGLAYEGACNLDAARVEFRRVLDLDPSHKAAGEHLARLTAKP